MQNTQATSPPNHVRIMCPNLTCKRILAVPSASRGKTVRCKTCGATIRVPHKAVAPEAAPNPDAAKAA